MGAIQIDQDLLDGFIEETQMILESTQTTLTEFTVTKNAACFEKYGQEIDRVMGAALTMGFKEVGELARLGKEVGYKSSQINDLPKLLVVHSLLFQLNKEIHRHIKSLQKGSQFDHLDMAFLIKKLQKASKDLGDLRASVKV
jgi:hypothetical protein